MPNGPEDDALHYRSSVHPVSGYLEAVASGVVIFDGATGTNLQTVGLDADDFGGPNLEGCNEVLNLSRPDVIRDLHRSFLDVGVDVVETNTFGAFAIPLGEYDLEDRSYEIAAAGAAIAREAVDSYRKEEHPRFVAGSMGPGTKFATLGQVSYRDLLAAYEVEAAGLIDGGVDLIIVETQFDLLGAKAAIRGARTAMKASGVEVPIQAQVTIELTGRMLPGTEIGAALTALESLGLDVIGINCATGPEEMYEPIRHLSRYSRRPVSSIPNAGLPKVVDGEMAYDLSPADLARHLSSFVSEFGVGVIGGCCGTTPAHLAAVVEAVRPLEIARREPIDVPSASSIYTQVPFDQDTSFLIIGERANANGSKAFREALLSGDAEGCVSIGQDQLKEGAHLVDLCVDYVGRDGVEDMARIASAFATDVAAPVVLDSTQPEVMEAGLEKLGGRSVLNSANLEDGEGAGSRIDAVLSLAAKHGAAVICLLIDEEGQARDLEWKMRVARRIHDLAIDGYGLDPSSLIFDPLTFPLSTGDDDLRRDAIETLEAIKRIKAELPGVRTVLGVSNVSFGLNPAARRVLNSVFLHEAVDAGLDAAIVHAGKIMPLSAIDPEQRDAALDLIRDRRRDGYDPLEKILELFSDVTTSDESVDEYEGLTVEERLPKRIIDGDQRSVIDDLDQALEMGHKPLDIVNRFLLDGMKTVGDLFASGEMQLPFVLKSAETMKKAVAHLEPLMEKSEATGKGTIVLATVSGDVHDIGKNLVDIILSNNGYEVRNLGIKVSIAEMIAAFEEAEADAIGMSGLLVKSTLIMKDNLDELERRGMGQVPVLLGGAALTRRYVESDLRAGYQGPLYYGRNAFAGLDAMEKIVAGEPAPPPAERRQVEDRDEVSVSVPPRSPDVTTDNQIYVPPFLGSRVIKGIPIDEISPYLNLTALFRNQWQYRPSAGEGDVDFKERLGVRLREELLKARADDLLRPQVVYGYFPANGDGNDLIIWRDESRNEELTRFTFPRQDEDPYLCIADFFRPVSSEIDYAAFHIVTMGDAVSERTASLFAGNDYQDYLHLHGLGVEMAEALAEYWHLRIREEWGFADQDGPTLLGLFRQKYRGGRYSWGYPACPDLEDNARVASLLEAHRIGVDVGAETGYQYQPEQTTSAIICHHPRAKYFVARSRKGTKVAQ